VKGELKDIKLKVNGKIYELKIKPKTLLVDVLRKELKLTGAKIGCLSSACGACTVNIDDKAVRSCSILAVQAQGHEITTIEGVGTPEKMHPIQAAMVSHGAIECGFCTSGMVMSARALLIENPKPSNEDIRKAIQGNVCADSGYVRYIEAIDMAAKQLSGGK
jgi:aerobic-type carbon monoxide dehydrogenase small subunit (CoxS/CutS family)